MDNFDMAMALIKEAQEEKRRVKQFVQEYAQLDFGDYLECQAFWKKWPKVPHKSNVNDNIKMARRLLMKEYM